MRLETGLAALYYFRVVGDPVPAGGKKISSFGFATGFETERISFITQRYPSLGFF